MNNLDVEIYDDDNGDSDGDGDDDNGDRDGDSEDDDSMTMSIVITL